MRDLDGRMAEITRRSQVRIKQIRKRRIGILTACLPVVLCVTLFMGFGVWRQDNAAHAPGEALKTESDEHFSMESSGNTVLKDFCNLPESEGTETNGDPTLELITAERRVKADVGSWYAEYTDAEGNRFSVDGEESPQLEFGKVTDPCVTTDENARLAFSEKPDGFTIECWPLNGPESGVENSKQVKADGDDFRLKKGCYMYRVMANWTNEEGDYKGIHYYFYVELTE